MFKHTEVLKYFSDVKAVAALRVAICSEDWYKGLSAKDRALVDAGVAEADKALQGWVKKAEAGGLDALRKAGMKVYENTPEERQEFAKLIRPVYEEMVGADIAKMFVEAAAKF
jgi:TRAP-type C4-dicarboxylate transport system substrate-binding protein